MLVRHTASRSGFGASTRTRVADAEMPGTERPRNFSRGSELRVLYKAYLNRDIKETYSVVLIAVLPAAVLQICGTHHQEKRAPCVLAAEWQKYNPTTNESATTAAMIAGHHQRTPRAWRPQARGKNWFSRMSEGARSTWSPAEVAPKIISPGTAPWDRLPFVIWRAK